MTPDFNLCDVCKEKCPPHHRLCVTYDRSSESSWSLLTGDASIDLDLCGTCAIITIKDLFLRDNGKPDYIQGSRLLAYLNLRMTR